MTRYVVKRILYMPAPAAMSGWQIVDTQPACEEYETSLGAVMTETKPPPWRQVAFCLKESHAKLVASALNTFVGDGYDIDDFVVGR